MSQLTPSSIYLGPWVDRTQGLPYGITVTLSHLGGTLLLSFTAVFTSFVLAQLWSVIVFIIHHVRSKSNPQSVLTHQRQSVLRNTGALLAGWMFMQQAYYWRGKERRAVGRSLGWAAIAAGFAIASGLAATLSGFAASKSSLNRLVVSDNCGFWSLTNPKDSQSAWSFTHAMVNDTFTSADYAQTCYGTSTRSSSQCQRYIKKQLNWSGSQNATCPFQSGICCSGDQAAFSMTTEALDSLLDLGINSRPSDRLHLQKRTTCSCLREKAYIRQDPFLKELWYYNYGSVGTGPNSLNFTYVYDLNARLAKVGYTLASQNSLAGLASGWTPIPALNRTDADVSIMFISANGLLYEYANSDDIFEATNKSALGVGYTATIDVSTIGCAEQYRVCNPAIRNSGDEEGSCSPWLGAYQLLYQATMLNDSINGHADTNAATNSPTENSTLLWTNDLARLNPRQAAIFTRLAWPLPWTSMYNAVLTRGPSALRLQSTVVNLVQIFPLSDNYWPTEVSNWFELGLARLQKWITDYATGPSFVADLNGTWTKAVLDEETKKLCKAQLTLDVGDKTINFSALALIIIYVLGIVIILASFNMEKLSHLLYFRRWPERSYKRTAWEKDGFLELQKRAFTTAGTAATTVDRSDSEDAEQVIDDGRIANNEWTSGSIPVPLQPVRMQHHSATTASYSSLRPQDQVHNDEDGVQVEREDWPLQRISVHAK